MPVPACNHKPDRISANIYNSDRVNNVSSDFVIDGDDFLGCMGEQNLSGLGSASYLNLDLIILKVFFSYYDLQWNTYQVSIFEFNPWPDIPVIKQYLKWPLE